MPQYIYIYAYMWITCVGLILYGLLFRWCLENSCRVYVQSVCSTRLWCGRCRNGGLLVVYSHGFRGVFAGCHNDVFCCVAKSRGIPITSITFKFPVSLSGEGCWDQRQLPRFLLSAFLHTAKAPWYLEGPPSLGWSVLTKKRQSLQSTRIFRCCLLLVDWMKKGCYRYSDCMPSKAVGFKSFGCKNNPRWNIHIKRGTQFPRQQRKGWTMVISKEKSYEFWILMDGSS